MKSMIRLKYVLIFFVIALLFASCTSETNQEAQEEEITDTNTPLHALQPDYDTPYDPVPTDSIVKTVERVHAYLDANTPMKLVDQETEEEITDLSNVDKNTILAPGDFRLISYEWGVTYAGMMLLSDVTGDNKFEKYAFDRLTYIKDILPHFKKLEEESADEWNALTSVIHPDALDDAGSMCAAMIKSKDQGLETDLEWMIQNFVDYIHNDQFRLDDGTLARNRPLPNTIWLDDLFMSVPALAQMGHYSGEQKYFDDAVKQVLQFAKRMFVEEKGLYMHGWVQDMEPHPAFHWGRANGWAIMAKAELLDVLPKDHPGYDKVMDLYKAHCKGLASYQSGKGFWHQLLNKTDSYLETSATAIYTYSIAKGINEGWLDEKAYGSVVNLAWNAVATQVNDKGQVEGTCVGTGMAFDPAFYYYRPINVYAAHGYGPVLLAGAEMIKLMQNQDVEINDSAVMFYE